MIHAPDTLVIHHDLITPEQKEFWHGYNLELFNQQFGEHANKIKRNRASCFGLLYDPTKPRTQQLPQGTGHGQGQGQGMQKGGGGGGGPHPEWLYSEMYVGHQYTVRKRYRERRDWNKHDSGNNDIWCENGILGKAMQGGHCRVCCEKKCGAHCGGRGCGVIDYHCCIGNIFKTGRLCNQSIAPCEMTVSDHCPTPIDYVSFS